MIWSFLNFRTCLSLYPLIFLPHSNQCRRTGSLTIPSAYQSHPPHSLAYQFYVRHSNQTRREQDTPQEVWGTDLPWDIKKSERTFNLQRQNLSSPRDSATDSPKGCEPSGRQCLHLHRLQQPAHAKCGLPVVSVVFVIDAALKNEWIPNFFQFGSCSGIKSTKVSKYKDETKLITLYVPRKSIHKGRDIFV